MSIFTIPFADIRLQHIEDLIEHQVPESRNLEFKRQLPGNSDSEKKEFLADVTAMANSGGGDIVYGMRNFMNKSINSYCLFKVSL